MLTYQTRCGGHIVFLVDENGSSCPLIWASNKIQRRIVRCSLSAEAMTMQDSAESSLKCYMMF